MIKLKTNFTFSITDFSQNFIVFRSNILVYISMNIHHMHILLEAFKHCEPKMTTFPTEACESHIQWIMDVYSNG